MLPGFVAPSLSLHSLFALGGILECRCLLLIAQLDTHGVLGGGLPPLSAVLVTLHFEVLALVFVRVYNGRSFLYISLNLLNSLRQARLTLMDLESNATRFKPGRDLTVESTMNAIPAANTLSERFIVAQSRDKTWHL